MTSMERKFEDLEILAPCGNLENFNTALNLGADAVYLGMSDFNARMKADNFNKDNIKEIVEQAHLLGTKVYLTVNTLIKTKEFPKLIETLKYAIKAKVDAFIVQDLGVAKLINEAFPGAVLHASTQLGIHNLYGAKILEKLGFSRVVLSRETKLEDIKEIAKNTNLEIEYFVHGALCVAFSGNCYLSSFKFGESGNRGRCLQLCRLPYTANYKGKIKEGYFLSPSDLCLINNLKTLIDAGVTSFKIEGRLKRAGYVARTIYSYKKALSFLDKNFDTKEEIEHLKIAFSRGDFNEEAYLDNRTPDNIINEKFNNHIGVQIGKVLASKKFKDLFELTLSSTHKISSGDGLKFFNDSKEIGSMGVGNVITLDKNTYKVYTKKNITAGASVYLTLDAENDANLLSKTKKLEIDGKITAKENLPLSLTLLKDKISATITSSYVCPKALNKETSKEEIFSQISKTGDSVFALNNLEIEKDNVFIPKSILNEIRRETLEKLERKIIDETHSKIIAKFDECKIQEFLNQELYIPKIKPRYIILFDSMLALEKILLKEKEITGSKIFVYAPKDYSIAKLEIEKFRAKYKNVLLWLNLPIIANGKDLKIIDNILNNNKEIGLIANNLYGLYYASLGYEVIAGTGLNIFNKFSANKILELGALNYVQSAELSKENLAEENSSIGTSNCNNVKNSLVYSLGYFPLMTFAHCPQKSVCKNSCKNCSWTENLTYENSQTKHKIRRYKISNCYFELLNSNLINNLFKHDYLNFIDTRELDENQIQKLINSLKNNQNEKLEEKENYGMLLKEIK